MNQDLVFCTAGDGYWSSRRAKVRIVGIDIPYLDESETDFAEMVVKFDLRDWNTDQDGLIYTDSRFIDDLRNYFIEHGFSRVAVAALDYSEQGMQGDDYVSLDASGEFLRQWRLFKEIYSPYIGAV